MDRQTEILQEARELCSSSDDLRKGQLIQSSTQRSETILSVRELITERPREMPSLQDVNRIHRIPPSLVKEKPEAYIPHLVAIGPFHHNQPHLQFMESRKMSYLDKFLSQSPAVLDDYIEAMIDLEERVRGSYQEAIKDELKIDKESFVMMLVVDGCFILQLLRSGNNETMSFRKWSFVVSLDLLLLENQLPFYVLQELFRIFKRHCYPDARGETIDGLIGDHSYVSRILELLVGEDGRSYCSGKLGALTTVSHHLLDFLRQILIPRKSGYLGELWRKKEGTAICIPCARDLQRANVKFVKNKNPESLLDIQFDNTMGVLTIPGLRIDCGTEMIIRNLIAYEQYTDDYSFITEYAAFLDGLIDSSKDVQLLQKSGIIEIILR